MALAWNNPKGCYAIKQRNEIELNMLFAICIYQGSLTFSARGPQSLTQIDPGRRVLKDRKNSQGNNYNLLKRYMMRLIIEKNDVVKRRAHQTSDDLTLANAAYS